MKLIAEKLGKSDKNDRLRFVRADGTQTQTVMPRQGTLPHDLVHFVIESAVPLEHGFLSQIASGSDAGFVMQAVHDRADATVDAEAIQVEAMVEALQTQLWAGSFEVDAFLDGVLSASAARGKAAFDLSDMDPQTKLYEPALALLERWNRVPYYQGMELSFCPAKPSP